MSLTVDSAAPPSADPEGVTAEERLALIDRVASSSQFSKSTRLRDFLRFVGRQAVKQNPPEIHEQEIGVHVFGRSRDYDRSADNIVRVNATELRKRIDSYFANEGAHETLTFSIPRGSYLPVFQQREVQAAELAGPPSDAPGGTANASPEEAANIAHPESQPAIRKATAWPWMLATALLAVACAVMAWQLRQQAAASTHRQDAPTVSAFWSAFARAGQTDVVLPDEAVSMSEEMVGRPMSLSEYLDRNYIAQFQNSASMSADRKSDLRTIFNHNLVTFGGFQAAYQVMSRAPSQTAMRLVHARFYEADSLKRNNLILVGGKKANPWVRLFDDQVDFSLDYDDARSQAFVANAHPRTGEQSQYQVVMDRNALYSYAVITYLPTPSRTGNVLILAGADSDATAAAAEFLTSENGLRKFREKLGTTKDFPYFEVILKTSRLSGTSFNAQPVIWRVRS